jgi:hypothetical protein
VAKTICTPDYSKIEWPFLRLWNWNIPISPFKRHVYWPVMNKPGSLKHLFEHFTFEEADTLIFLDPDMVFTKPWIPVFDRGTVFGQKWFGYSKSYCEQSSIHPELCPETDSDCVMYPFAIKAGDLKKMLPDIEHFALEGYKTALSNDVSGHWMSDMPAFQTAMTKHELVMEPATISDFATIGKTETTRTRQYFITASRCWITRETSFGGSGTTFLGKRRPASSVQPIGLIVRFWTC